MRHQGTIVSWDLGRGIGAIQWHGGDERVFVRLTDFPGGTRRPEVGDVVTYFRGSDERGRPIASIVEYATAAGMPPPTSPVRATDSGTRAMPAHAGRAPIGHGRHEPVTNHAETPSFARASNDRASFGPWITAALIALILIIVVAWTWF